MRCFLKNRDEIFEVKHAEYGTLDIDETFVLKNLVHKYVHMLPEIEVITESLQTHRYTLARSRGDIYFLIASVVEGKTLQLHRAD